MRIGVSGAHGTGKTTLVGLLCEALPGHKRVDEPYVLLEEEGHEFSHPPTAADYQRQLARSVLSLRESAPSVVFDRTPLDFLAYLAAGNIELTTDRLPAQLWPALASLDLLVIVPTPGPAARVLPPVEFPRLQHAMDGALRELVFADPLDLLADVEVVEAPVALESRARAVLRAARQAAS